MDNVTENPGNTRIMEKLEIELQKELNSIELNNKILPKTPKSKKE